MNKTKLIFMQQIVRRILNHLRNFTKIARAEIKTMKNIASSHFLNRKEESAKIKSK